jgi:predicted Zn-dependent protease
VFSGRIGERVAAKGVTVVDDGTIADRRGLLNIDDEGEQTRRTVLIEDGVLKGYLQDRLNAPADEGSADRQWASRILCPSPNAPDDQYHHAQWR